MSGSGSQCRICGCLSGSPLLLRELMYGTKEEFEYWQCGACGSLQIAHIPEDLSRHYPLDYYSFAPRRIGLRRRCRLEVAALVRRLGPDLLRREDQLRYLLSLLPTSGGRVIDVGAGDGYLIRQLRFFGHECEAVDVYLGKEGVQDGVRFRRCTLAEVEGEFDLIMLDHSLEHMEDPDSVFASIGRLLSSRGFAHLRLPVIPNNVWDEFGIFWPQLDAPRHLYTFSVKALKGLAARHSLTIRDARYDARPWSLAVARAYRDGRRLAELGEAEKAGSQQDGEETRRANETHRGDQVQVLLSRSGQDSSG